MAQISMKRGFVRALVFSALLMMGASPVFAGFEWKGSAASPAPAFSGSGVEMPSQKVQGIESVPIPAVPGNKFMPAAGELVSGFGDNMPLTVALQQILPPDYGFSFASGINRDITVSWQGERPWQEVLTEMLAAKGLGFSFDGNVVVVQQMADVKPPRPATVSKVDMIPSNLFSPRENYSAPAAPVARPTSLRDVPAYQPASSVWQAAKGQTLKSVLNNWSQIAEVGLYWSIDYDYKLAENVSLSGNYDEAVGQLLGRFAKARPQPYGRLHRERDGDRVLVVQSYDVSN